MEKHDIKKYNFQPISNDVDFSAQDRFLFEFTGIKAIEEITQPMNKKTDQAIIEALFQYR